MLLRISRAGAALAVAAAVAGVPASADAAAPKAQAVSKQELRLGKERLAHMKRAKQLTRRAIALERTARSSSVRGRAAAIEELRDGAAAAWKLANKGLYRCADPDPDAASPPPLTPGQKQQQAEAVPPPRLCPEGKIIDVKIPEDHDEVAPPYPNPAGYPQWALDKAPAQAPVPGRHRGRSRASSRGPLARASNNPCVANIWAYYCWASGSQTVPWTDGTNYLEVEMTENMPALDPKDGSAHTLAQLWGIDYTPGYPGSTQEMGWIRAPQFASGVPTLFVYHFDMNAPTAYNQAGGWVAQPAEIQPGLPIWNWGQFNYYRTMYWQGNWWFAYNGTWIGYIPGSAYPQYLNTGFLRIDAGGEVASSTTTTPCSAMGSGWRADIAPDANNAATVNNAVRNKGGVYQSVQFSLLTNYYPIGFWLGGPPNSYFRYGGPGFKAC